MALAADDRPTGLTQQPGDFLRDQRGTPWVTDPSGDLVKSGERKGEMKLAMFGRPSSLGKQIENTFNLQRWNERQIVYGVAVDVAEKDAGVGDELIHRLMKLAELDKDSDAGHDAADGVITLAKRIAKAGLAAERGTHMHAVTEDDDNEQDWVARAERGEDLGVPRHVQQAMLEAWRRMLDAYGLVVLGTEEKVVHDGYRQAGTLDRRLLVTRTITFANGVSLTPGMVVLGDVKTGALYFVDPRTGKTATKISRGYWHSYNVQCVPYADGVPYDPSTGLRGTWPEGEEMDSHWAVILHLPVDEALAGKAVCRLVLVDLDAAREAIEKVVLPMKEWQARRDIQALVADDEPVIEIPIDTPSAPAAEQDDELLQQLEQSVAIVEAAKAQPVLLDRPKVTRSGEGAPLSAVMQTELKRRFVQLHPDCSKLLSSLTREASLHGHSFAVGKDPTERRRHLYRAFFKLADRYGDQLDHDVLRATVALVLPAVNEHPNVRLGPAIGSLDLLEAQRLVQAVVAVGEADPQLTYDSAGRPSWVGVTLPQAA